MKIAHIGNTAGVASTLACEQRTKGHTVDVFVFDDITEKQFGGTRIKYSRYSKWLFHRKLESYDVWHYHYPYGVLKQNLEKRRRYNTYLKHYHGDDLRTVLKHEDDFCIVATPDLLKFAPNGKWLPTPIKFEKNGGLSTDNELTNKIPLVAHYPYYSIMESHVDYHSKILTRLEKQGKCVVKRIINVSHAISLKMIASCDIVVGKIIPEMGWFGKFELEGMSLGKPVITYVSEDLYDMFRPPVCRTTKDTFEKDLVALINNDYERNRLSRVGLEYIRENHSTKNIVETLEKYYTIKNQ